ncbi:alpha-glucan family phosphorylase [Novipirellula rosea]|uniref:Alpha-glucan family phosphorylase n=1 Tax=Novipirellula rosea TaxID=1031540 RepID=A0ABP8NQX6_9BACT
MISNENEKNPLAPTVAYFSMEIALDPAMPTYSGGLGVLAGDTLRAAADMNVPVIAVTLLHRQGYLSQTIDAEGWQHEQPVDWNVEEHCRELPQRAEIEIEGRRVHVRVWQYDVVGCEGHCLPVLLLDTDLDENADIDRALTQQLYGGDSRRRLCQEVVLGIGGVRILRSLRLESLVQFHMNEGHAALLGLELLDERSKSLGRELFNSDDVQAVRNQCVFTTHTPVPAGHDRFGIDLVEQLLGRSDLFDMHEVFCCAGELNMTYLALNLSHYVNGVAKKHGEVSRQMLVPKDANHHYAIDHITNGVHAATWAAPSFSELFDRFIPGWREDNASLRGSLVIPSNEISQAHRTAKLRLIDEINATQDVLFDPLTFTIGFARRATAYKRANLLISDPERLHRIVEMHGPIQIVFAGKAHPHDVEGKRLIQQIVRAKNQLHPAIKLVYLENYDWELARLIVSGVDVWLNTPQPPLEASGTSGMKAAINGVPSVSILDGWWIEGCIEGTTGWAFGNSMSANPSDVDRFKEDADALYDKLDQTIVPLYYKKPDQWLRIMTHAIALNGSYFNTQRMVQQYVVKAYYET